MNKSTLLALGSALVFGLPMIAAAYDIDPGYGQYRPWYGGDDRTWRGDSGNNDRDYRRRLEPVYYRPTQRYFAKGYTVSYRYMPIYWYESGNRHQQQSSNFRTEGFRIETNDIAAWGARSPRLIVPTRKPPQQSAITSIVPSYGTPNASTSTSGGPNYGVPTFGMPDLRRDFSIPALAPSPAPTAPVPATPSLDPATPASPKP